MNHTAFSMLAVLSVVFTGYAGFEQVFQTTEGGNPSSRLNLTEVYDAGKKAPNDILTTEAEWRYKNGNADNKFPLRNEFASSTAVYKEIGTGASIEWVRQYLSHGNFTGVTNRASSLDDCLCSTSTIFYDGERKICLDFASVSKDGAKVLIRGTIEFPKGDVSEGTLIAKYRKQMPDAIVTEQEKRCEDGGGMLFGVVIPHITWLAKTTTFETSTSQVKVIVEKAFTVDVGSHHVDESGEYTGPASVALSASLVLGSSVKLSPMEYGNATNAQEAWASLNEKSNVPKVVIIDKPLCNASVSARAEEVEREEAKAKHDAEEAEKLRMQEEAKRANDF